MFDYSVGCSFCWWKSEYKRLKKANGILDADVLHRHSELDASDGTPGQAFEQAGDIAEPGGKRFLKSSRNYWRDRCYQLNGICRGLAEQVESLTKRLHDKNESVTELQNKNKMLTKRLEDLEKIIVTLGEKKPEIYDWRGAYWEVVGKLAARRDECKDLVEKLRDREPGDDATFWRTEHHRVKQELELAVCGTEDVEVLKANLAIERDRTAFLEKQLNGILTKNIDISKTEQTIENLVEECRKVKDEKDKQISDLVAHHKEIIVAKETTYDYLSKGFKVANLELAAEREKSAEQSKFIEGMATMKKNLKESS